MNRTDLFLFESAFARDTYQRIVGTPRGIVRVVPNGVSADEMVRMVEPTASAADIINVGEFRHIKGTDVLIDAVAELHGRDGASASPSPATARKARPCAARSNGLG